MASYKEEEEKWIKTEKETSVDEKKAHTVKQVRACMNSILDFLEFTTETEQDYKETGGWIPTLDFNIKMLDNGEIVYKFFRKTNSSQVHTDGEGCTLQRISNIYTSTRAVQKNGQHI